MMVILLIKLLGMCHFSVSGPWVFAKKIPRPLGILCMKVLLTLWLPGKMVRIGIERDIINTVNLTEGSLIVFLFVMNSFENDKKATNISENDNKATNI